MKRALQLLVMVVSVLTFNACKNDITFCVYEFDNSKTEATDIKINSASLHCQLVKIEDGEISPNRDFYMFIADYPEYFDGVIKSSGWRDYRSLGRIQEGDYSADFTGLAASTTYYYAPFVPNYDTYPFDINGEGLIRAEVKSFTTKGIPSISVTTGDATNLTISSATLSGSCELINEAVLKESGILLHTSSYMSYFSYTKRFYGTFTDFIAEAKDLTSNTTYYYCAYAIDENGNKYYGEVKSFKTLVYKAAISEFLGTYTVKYNSVGTNFSAYDVYQTKDVTYSYDWDYNQTGKATIKKIVAPSGASGLWVKMTFTSQEGNQCALSGKYDEEQCCICLYGDMAGDYSIPGLNATGGICEECGVWSGGYYGHFTIPVYCLGSSIYLLSSGYGYKGSVEIRLVKSGPNAQIELSAPDKDEKYGYYPNGIGHYDAWCGSPNSQGSFYWSVTDGGVEYTSLTFTKQ